LALRREEIAPILPGIVFRDSGQLVDDVALLSSTLGTPCMNRREALRLLAAGTTLPLTSRSLLALKQARLLIGDAVAPRTLNSHQFTTVKTIAEMILPRTNTPGATDVGAAGFVDLILTEWCSDETRARFLSGLADVDASTHTFFAKDFIECSAQQQADILTALGDKLLEEAEAVREQARPSHSPRPELPRNFYAALRRLTLTAYYTSEAGATSELNFEMIPGHYDGCAPPTSKQSDTRS
jgi:gluconate 2-dehydrogenase gamma chain